VNDVEERMAALRGRFAAAAPQQAAALRAAVGAQDRGRVAEIAHHLAGASGIFGQPALGEQALRLEEAVDARADARQIDALADTVLTTLDRIGQAR
jgi:HPt (histidine-containing phosphotransfer) domain-containing protein